MNVQCPPFHSIFTYAFSLKIAEIQENNKYLTTLTLPANDGRIFVIETHIG